MRETNRLYSRIQHEPKIYGLSFMQLLMVIGVLMFGLQLGRPLGLLLTLGISAGMAGGVYLALIRYEKSKEGLGNDKLAHLIKNSIASNEHSGESFEILNRKDTNNA